MLPSTIATTDYRTGGEPFRIVADPPVAIPSTTVADRRTRAVIPQVTGMAYRTGGHVFAVDPHGRLVPGFLLR